MTEKRLERNPGTSGLPGLQAKTLAPVGFPAAAILNQFWFWME